MTHASDAAIERVAERWNAQTPIWSDLDYCHDGPFKIECDREQALSDALRAHFGDAVPDSLAGFVLPVVVDPIVQMVREAFATEASIGGCGSSTSDDYRSGFNDKCYEFRAALSVARAIAAQGGGK